MSQYEVGTKVRLIPEVIGLGKWTQPLLNELGIVVSHKSYVVKRAGDDPAGRDKYTLYRVFFPLAPPPSEEVPMVLTGEICYSFFHYYLKSEDSQ